jgi:hypothetical protein
MKTWTLKMTNHSGIVKIYAGLFEQAGINYNIILAGDREKNRIEKNFENWNHADNYLFHFPGFNQYLAPTATIFRMPWVPPSWAGAPALYCKTTTLGELKSAYADIRTVPMENYIKTEHSDVIGLKFSKTLDTLVVDLKQIYTGYSQAYYRAPMILGPEDQQREMLKSFVKSNTNSENIVTHKFTNKEFESNPEEPFLLEATVNAPKLVEKAGNKLLVKIGDVIGPQVQMYDEKPRQLPVEIDYPHVLDRKVSLTIPDGYVVKNLNDLNFNITDEKDGKVTMGFVSDYKQEGNVVTVHVREEYREITYPMSNYELFKKVINAAADFNKVVLVLEKSK